MSSLRPATVPASRWLEITGFLLILAGIIALALPFTAGVAAAVYIGVALLFAGVLHLVYAYHLRHSGHIGFQVLVGILYTLGGLWIMIHPVSGLLAVTWLLGFFLLIAAIGEFIAYFGLRGVPGTTWILVTGIINLLLAGLILTHLMTAAAWLPGTLIGLAILMSGTSRLALGMAARRTALLVS